MMFKLSLESRGQLLHPSFVKRGPGEFVDYRELLNFRKRKAG